LFAGLGLARRLAALRRGRLDWRAFFRIGAARHLRLLRQDEAAAGMALHRLLYRIGPTLGHDDLPRILGFERNRATSRRRDRFR
jgi:hypothetical protein